jgi:hypothetical protein
LDPEARFGSSLDLYQITARIGKVYGETGKVTRFWGRAEHRS